MKKFLAEWIAPIVVGILFLSVGSDYVITYHTIRGYKCREQGGRFETFLVWPDSPCIKTTVTRETLKID